MEKFPLQTIQAKYFVKKRNMKYLLRKVLYITKVQFVLYFETW